MIKFFRKIRQNLLSENKFSKYLIYAIGEIILVVVGILIALSINNWNESKKLNKEIISLSKSIINELESDIKAFDKSIIINDSVLNTSAVIFDSISNTKSGNVKKLLGLNIRYWDFRPNNAVYKSSVSSGLLPNYGDSLEIKIIDYYEKRYTVLKIAALEQTYYAKKVSNLLINEFPNYTLSNEAYNIRALEIIGKDHVINTIYASNYATGTLQQVMKETKEKAEQLIASLEQLTE
ncbi:hypothetical protein SAMN04488009_3514 [Maribacter sedimenticola]|uniref:Uncharacterized protein n=1 Tax=Maribacter sedimenticola TaxID=228956 RepID=A0ABY1SL45_9FLAO|nr:DUF6090 family protein [Maribacter sedimenticola]SNR73910.1 hypothetical protein SAMN04488009_3514 [Maribacter sedimenticola]